MNRYQFGGPSKATATTQCQKCLKRGHYSYECTGAKQERPYVSRPSRTQQLLNPKLVPKLSSAPKPPIGVRDDAPSQSSLAVIDSRGRSRDSKKDRDPSRERRRSVSPSSSRSVSTISTNRSDSRSPDNREKLPAKAGRVEQDRSTRRRSYSSSRSRSISHSPIAKGAHPTARADHAGSRRSRSPERDRRARSASSSRSPPPRVTQGKDHRQYRERSLSPYSRRVALSRASGGS